MKEVKPLDFHAILAASVHDMKNSLGMLLNSIDELCSCDSPQARQIQYEARRVNNDLIRLLSLYKMEEQHYRPLPDEVMVLDLLEECYQRNQPLFEQGRIAVAIECDPGLFGFFDREMVAGVVDNVMTNALRYSRSALALRARQEEGWLVIEVCDDGAGFPPAMLSASAAESGIDFTRGNTGLGLYFARRIAALHCNGGRCGEVILENGGPLGGGVFRLTLP